VFRQVSTSSRTVLYLLFLDFYASICQARVNNDCPIIYNALYKVGHTFYGKVGHCPTFSASCNMHVVCHCIETCKGVPQI